jgi:hypothetical protein
VSGRSVAFLPYLDEALHSAVLRPFPCSLTSLPTTTMEGPLNKFLSTSRAPDSLRLQLLVPPMIPWPLLVSPTSLPLSSSEGEFRYSIAYFYVLTSHFLCDPQLVPLARLLSFHALACPLLLWVSEGEPSLCRFSFRVLTSPFTVLSWCVIPTRSLSFWFIERSLTLSQQCPDSIPGLTPPRMLAASPYTAGPNASDFAAIAFQLRQQVRRRQCSQS